MSNSTITPFYSSFVFLNTVFISIDFTSQEIIEILLDKGYIQAVFSSFGEETIILYKVFPNSALAQKEQSSLSF